MPVHTLVLALALGAPALVSMPPRPCGIDSAATIPAGPLTSAVCPRVPRAPEVSSGEAHRLTLGLMRNLRPSAQPVASRVLVVRIYDTAGLDRFEEGRALDMAARILGPSGLRPRWRLCGGRRKADHTCGAVPEPGELIVRFMRATQRTPADLLGFSYVPGIVATVLVDRVRAFSERSDTERGILLGAALAHELAHLLVGAPSHADRGLMRASWGDEEIRRAGAQGFALTPADREQLSESVGARPGVQD
jgi:hypothetical protein